MSKKIRCVKMKRKGDRITVVYEKLRQNGEDYDKYAVHLLDEAMPSFYNALKDVGKEAGSILEMPADYSEDMFVIGVSFKHSDGQDEDGELGVVVSLQRNLVDCDSPAFFNTPFLPETATAPKSCMTPEMAAVFHVMHEECVKYALGERKQLTLSLEKKEDDALLDKAKDHVVNTQRASTSSLRRKLKIGYVRAQRIIETLEEQGVIGALNGSQPREVLVA